MTIKNYGPVRNCMTDQVVEIDGRLDVLSALKLMKKTDGTSLIVKRRDENDEYGMLLFSDIARQVLVKNRAPERVSVYEIMVKPMLTVRADMEIRYCARLFERFDVSQAPVVEDNKIVGLVSYHRLVLEGMLPGLEDDG